MSALKAVAKRGVVRAAAALAPLTWRWRAPGSLVVLMYHRVLPMDSAARRTEQPGMYVSPETLDLHLAELRRYFELVHLDDWLRGAREGKVLPRLACAITFDDGWRDNFEFALPVLRKHEAPATIFLVSSYTGSGRRFWPNRLMGLLQAAFFRPGSVRFPRPLLAVVEPVLATAGRRGELLPDDGDCVVETAKQFGEDTIRELISMAEQSCGGPTEVRDILNRDEVAQLAATGLVRFGSHTATHFRLGGPLSPPELEREIVLSRGELQELCGQPIDVFCYPNGETSPAAVALCRQHYVGAVTTKRGWHSASRDPHLVRRIELHDDISSTPDAFLSRVSSWT